MLLGNQILVLSKAPPSTGCEVKVYFFVYCQYFIISQVVLSGKKGRIFKVWSFLVSSYENSWRTHFDHQFAFTSNSLPAFRDTQNPKTTPRHHSPAPGFLDLASTTQLRNFQQPSIAHLRQQYSDQAQFVYDIRIHRLF
jgi:hypothetical protein